MPFFTEIIFFAFGAIIASFMGVVVGRMGTGQSVVRGRSKCDACGEPLSAFSLVPIISWGVTRGRAQCCGARVSYIGPLSEIMLGALYVLAYQSLGLTLSLVFSLIALATLLGLVLYDLAHQILPTLLLAVFLAASALFAFSNSASLGELMQTVEIALLLGGVLAAIHFLSRGRAMGLADAPLCFGLALLAGENAISGFVFSFWIGAVVGVALLAQRRYGFRMKSEVPFAPFLAAGFLIALFTEWNLFMLLGN